MNRPQKAVSQGAGLGQLNTVGSLLPTWFLAIMDDLSDFGDLVFTFSHLKVYTTQAL